MIEFEGIVRSKEIDSDTNNYMSIVVNSKGETLHDLLDDFDGQKIKVKIEVMNV